MELKLLLVIAAITSSTTEANWQEIDAEVTKAGYGEICPSEEVCMEVRQTITTRVKEILSST